MAAGEERIAAAFEARNSTGALAFIPFVTAGDPHLAATEAAIRQLAAAGADLIEVGFPYSDPIADGPVIQASYQRALNAGLRLDGIFAMAGRVSREVACPLLAMVSYAIVFKRGAERFCQEARAAGFTGLIVPDLPGDEAQPFSIVANAAGLALAPLVAPTTPAARVAKIVATGSGFLYCMAVAGTTGAREAIPADLQRMLAGLRTETRLPLAVGFGLSRPEQILALHGHAQGAIVGSALVKCFEHGADDAAMERLTTLARQLAGAAHTVT